jgi:hypothetical protein
MFQAKIYAQRQPTTKILISELSWQLKQQKRFLVEKQNFIEAGMFLLHNFIFFIV